MENRTVCYIVKKGGNIIDTVGVIRNRTFKRGQSVEQLVYRNGGYKWYGIPIENKKAVEDRRFAL